MKRTTLALAALGGALVTGLTACGDDVINVTNEDVYSIVDSLDSTDCNKDNEGEMALVKTTGKLYTCKDGEWTAVNAAEAIQLRCKSEPLKDSTGYRIFCDDEEIGVVYNGKDGSKGSSGKSAYELAKEAGFEGSVEDWLKTLQGKDGKSAYEEAKAKGFEGSEEDWLKILKGEDGKDGKSAYELAKDAGFKGTEEEWLKILKGKDGKDVNVDSLAKAIAGDVTGVLVDSLKCKIDTNWTDEKKGEINVQVTCGDDVSVITLPKLIPNKNLTNHYKKHVVVRFPVSSQVSDGENIYEEMWSNVQGNNFAELVVMEVDSSFDQTGKAFVAEMIAANGKPFVTVEDVNANTVNYKVVRLEGDIDVTNLISSLAQLRVSLDLKANMFSGNSQVAFNAFVDLDEEGDIVIDFLTDYKAARVKELLKEMKFAAASAQANEELVKAFYISDDAENFQAFEHYLPSEINLNEQFASVVWPVALLDQSGSQNFNTVYADYRSLFAKEGSFKKAVEVTYNGKVRSMFLADVVAMLMKQNFTGYCQGYFSNCSVSDTIDAMYNVAKYKFIQAAFKEAYKLPDVKKDAAVAVSGGFFDYFVYSADAKLWWPMEPGTFEKLTRNNNYLGDGQFDGNAFDQDKFTSLLNDNGKCDKENAGEQVSFLFEGKTVLMNCYYSEDDAGSGYWYQEEYLNDALCEGKKENDYGVMVDPWNYSRYFRCDKNPKEGETGLIVESVYYSEYAIGKPCNSKSEDKLYEAGLEENYFMCADTSYNHDGSGYGYVELYPSEDDDFNVIVDMQAGDCAEAQQGNVVKINKDPKHKTKAVCDGGTWKHLGINDGEAVEEELGVCNETVMKLNKVYHVDIEEIYLSTTTGYDYLKCDCDFVAGETQGTGSFEDCQWAYATNRDIKLDLACNAGNQDANATADGEALFCSETQYGHDWADLDVESNCPAIVAPDGGMPWVDGEPCEYPCNYAGNTYYYSQKDKKWITLDAGKSCVSVEEYCEENEQALEKEVCPTRATRATSECVTLTATVCLVKDAIHKETLMEKIVYPTSASSAAVFRTDEELCNAAANGSSDGSYQSNNINLLENAPYAIFLDGYAMEGVVLPEVFKVESMRAVQSFNCTKVTDIQAICSVLHSDIVNPENTEESSCDNPCVYGGETYYYNFNYKNGPDDYGKWMTLEEMGLTQCSSVEDYCDNHNTLNRACTTVDFCEETENAEGCVDYDDYDGWTCPEYPFMRMTPRCQDGIWYSGQA